MKLIDLSLRRNCPRQFKYEMFRLITTIIQEVPQGMPIYQSIIEVNILTITEVLALMTVTANKDLNRDAILNLLKLLQAKNEEITDFVLITEMIIDLIDMVRIRKIQKVKSELCKFVQLVF